MNHISLRPRGCAKSLSEKDAHNTLCIGKCLLIVNHLPLEFDCTLQLKGFK